MVNELLHRELTGEILKAFYIVYNKLGHGFLEKIYENALTIELRNMGLTVEQQQPIKVYYDSIMIGDYFADIVVNDAVILELKAAEALNPAHDAQLGNYLKATNIEVGILLNFGVKPEFRRRVFTNVMKKRR